MIISKIPPPILLYSSPINPYWNWLNGRELWTKYIATADAARLFMNLLLKLNSLKNKNRDIADVTIRGLL
jgi:hypothetical protein